MTKIVIDTGDDIRLEAKVKDLLVKEQIGYKICDSKDEIKVASDSVFRKERHERAVEAAKRLKRVSIKW